LVNRVGAVPPAVLLHLDALAVVHLVLGGDVVAPLAGGALQRDCDALLRGLGHSCSSVFATSGFPWGEPEGGASSLPLRLRADRESSVPMLCFGTGYLMILVTRPASTVRPPSRMANRRPSSIAIGWISSTCIVVLSPGMHISVPSGSSMWPVMSVVRKKNCGR